MNSCVTPWPRWLIEAASRFAMRRQALAASSSAGTRAGRRTEILAHIGDLLDWLLSQAKGAEKWKPQPAGEWDADVQRFFDGLAALDAYLASDAPLGVPAQQMFQGGVADALTHVGQIAFLRRLAGARGARRIYFRAEISAGRVGAEQSSRRREFDGAAPGGAAPPSGRRQRPRNFSSASRSASACALSRCARAASLRASASSARLRFVFMLCCRAAISPRGPESLPRLFALQVVERPIHRNRARGELIDLLFERVEIKRGCRWLARRGGRSLAWRGTCRRRGRSRRRRALTRRRSRGSGRLRGRE